MSLGNFVKRFRDITRNDAGINGDAQRIEQLTWMLFLKIYDDMESESELLDPSYQSIVPQELRWHNWADTANNKALKGDELLTFIDNVLFTGLKNLELPANCPMFQAIIKSVFTDIHNYMKNGTLIYQVLELINECDFSDPKQSHTFGTIYESILKELQSAGASGEFYTPRALTDFMAQHVNLQLGDKVADFACGTGGFLKSAYDVLAKQTNDGKVSDLQVLNSSFYGVEKKPLPYLLSVTNLLLHRIEQPHIVNGNSLSQNVDDYTDKDKFSVILMNPPYGGSELDIIQKNFPSNLRSAETADLFMTLIMYRLAYHGRAAVVIPDGLLFGGGNKRAIKERLLQRFNLHTILRLPTSVFAPYTSIATNVLFFDRLSKEEEQANKGWSTKQTWFYRMDMPQGYKNFSKTKPLLLEHMKDLEAWWNNREEIIVDGFPKAKAFTPDELKQLDFNFAQCGFPTVEEEILPPDELIAQYQAKRQEQEAIVDKALANILALINAKE